MIHALQSCVWRVGLRGERVSEQVSEWTSHPFDVVRMYFSGWFFLFIFRSTNNLSKWNRFVWCTSVQCTVVRCYRVSACLYGVMWTARTRLDHRPSAAVVVFQQSISIDCCLFHTFYLQTKQINFSHNCAEWRTVRESTHTQFEPNIKSRRISIRMAYEVW